MSVTSASWSAKDTSGSGTLILSSGDMEDLVISLENSMFGKLRKIPSPSGGGRDLQSLLGPAPLLNGEDAAAYDELRRRMIRPSRRRTSLLADRLA